MLTSTSRDQKVRKKKPKLTITNLATAINPLNYDPNRKHPTERSVTGSIVEKKKSYTRELHFSTSLPRKEVTPLLPEGNAGPTPDANKLTTAREAFDFFLERKVVWKIVEYTNNSIAYYLQTVKEARRSESNYDKQGIPYDDSDVESEVDVTGFEADSLVMSDDPENTSENLLATQNLTDKHTDPVFVNFLQALETENPSPTEEQKRLLRYLNDLESLTWDHTKECNYVTLEEIYAVIGLMYYRGMMQLNNTTVDRLFGGKDSVPVFGATMTRFRFQFIKNHMSFDPACSLLEEKSRQESDKFGLVRNLFEYMNKRFCEAMVPEKFLTVEEYFYFLRTQDKLGLKYIPVDINNTRGLIFKTVRGVESQYTYRAHVYTTPPVEPPTRYFHKTPEEEVKFMVQEVDKHHSLKGRNLTTGRAYTSVGLAEWLRDTKEMSLVGELSPSTPGFPDELRRVSGEEVFSSSVFHEPQADIYLCSYVVPSKCPDSCCKLRNQTFITTLNPILGTSKDKKKRPAIAQIYEYTKGRHETQKQSPPSYTCKPKCLKWTLAGFAFILDLIRINSSIVVNTNRKDTTSESEFGYELARSLILPFLYSRSKVGLNYVILTKMYQVTNDEKYLYAGNVAEVPETCVKGTKSKCFYCLESIRGPWFSERKVKLSRAKAKCHECGVISCKAKHSIMLCKTCYGPPSKRKSVSVSSSVEGQNETVRDSVGDQIEGAGMSEVAQLDSELGQNEQIPTRERNLIDNNGRVKDIKEEVVHEKCCHVKLEEEQKELKLFPNEKVLNEEKYPGEREVYINDIKEEEDEKEYCCQTVLECK